jgi:GABA permease
VLREITFDEIIVSTLPAGPSRWLKRDLPHRVEREYGLPVTHVVAASETAAR